MGNVHQKFSSLGQAAQKSICEAKEKEVNFNNEICHEASAWLRLLAIVHSKLKGRIWQYHEGVDSWLNEATTLNELCMICQISDQPLTAERNVPSLSKCTGCHRRVCETCCIIPSANKSQSILCYPCLWRRKVSQITGEWFDDYLLKMLQKQIFCVQDGCKSDLPNCSFLSIAEKIFLSKIAFPQGAIELKLKLNKSSLSLEVVVIAAYNLSYSSSNIVNPVVKLALLVSDNYMQAVVQQSETLYDTRNPIWGTTFEFDVFDDNMSEKKLVIIVCSSPGKNRRKEFTAEVIIPLCNLQHLANIPHILKLTNQPSLDSLLPSSTISTSSSLSHLSSHETTDVSNTSIEKGSPVFSTDGFIPHSLVQSSKAFSCYNLAKSTWTDSDSSFDSASSDESTSCDELLLESSSSIENIPLAADTVGKLMPRKKRRKCSRDHRKSLMHRIHIARCRNENNGAPRSTIEDAIPKVAKEYLPAIAIHRSNSAGNLKFARKEDTLKNQKLPSSVRIQPKHSSGNCGTVELSLLHTNGDGHLVVKFHSAHELPLEIKMSSSYVFKISIKGKWKVQSHTATCNTTAPQFEQSYLFTAVNKLQHILKIKLYYKRSTASKRFKIGGTVIHLIDVPETELTNGLKKEYKLICSAKYSRQTSAAVLL